MQAQTIPRQAYYFSDAATILSTKKTMLQTEIIKLLLTLCWVPSSLRVV